MDETVARAAAAVARLREAEEHAARLRVQARDAIIDALRDAPRGRQAELTRATGYSRERLRQLARTTLPG